MRRATTHGYWLIAALAAAAVCTALAAPAQGAATDARQAASQAAWRPFDVYVELHALPRAYTCTELWYRFHDVLMAIGARPYPKIVTFQCGNTAATSGRSPSVQVQFQLPDALPASLSKYADITVQHATVALAPGKLPSFTSADCELLRQMNTRLLAALPVHVSGEVRCAAPGARPERYALEVQALLPHS
jgi:hypothetical protein